MSLDIFLNVCLFSFVFLRVQQGCSCLPPPPLDSVRVRIKVCKAFGIQRNASYQELLWLCTSWLCYVSGQACLKQGSFQELGMISVNLGPKENRTVGPPRSYGQTTTIEKVMILWREWMEFPPSALLLQQDCSAEGWVFLSPKLLPGSFQ